MRKIRYALTLITLVASLTGFTLGLGSGSLATLASNQHVTTHAVAISIRQGPCPTGGPIDC